MGLISHSGGVAVAAKSSPEPDVVACQFDGAAVYAAIDQLAGLIEGLHAQLAALDQKVTQLRTVEHQSLLQTVKQVRGALDMATRDSKRQLEALTAKLLTATVRIQSLDLALSNHKLDRLSARIAAQSAGASAETPSKEGTARASEEAAD